MEQVLQNESLLSEIFSWLRPMYGDKSSISSTLDRQTCLFAATTCKSFLSPALDSLWQTMVKFEHIIRVLPQARQRSITDYQSATQVSNDLFSLPKSDNVALKYDLKCIGNPIQKVDIQRLLFYTRRIKTLNLLHGRGNKGILGDIEPFVVAELMVALNGDPLFPCLRALQIQPHFNDEKHLASTTPFLPLFHSPMLRTLVVIPTGRRRLATPSYSPELWRFFQMLPAHSSAYLKHLCVLMNVPNDAFKMLPQMRSLTTLVLDSQKGSEINLALLGDLTQLEHLGHLTIRLTGSYSQRAYEKPSVRPAFQNLKALILYADFASTHALLSLFSFPSLENLKFDYRGTAVAGTDAHWETFIQQLADNLTSVSDLELSSQHGEYVSPEEDLVAPRTLLPWSTFAPLLRLSLRILDIKAPRVDKITNDDFENMASSWANLQVLSIATRKLGGVDHSALPVVASKLKYLEGLFLSLDLTNASPMCIPKAHRPQSKLTTLVIRQSKPDPEIPFNTQKQYDITRFFYMLFPSLKDVLVTLSPPTPDLDMNENLQAFVTGLQEARKWERSVDMQVREGNGNNRSTAPS